MGALPLAEMIAAASDRCSKTGPSFAFIRIIKLIVLLYDKSVKLLFFKANESYVLYGYHNIDTV